MSFGQGLTSKLDIKELGGRIFIDTPGLADKKLREEAAQTITEALQRGGMFKICFVVTLDSGRPRPDDLCTMKLVMDAAKIPENRYGVNFNKLSPEAMRILRNEVQKRRRLLETLFGDVKPTKFVFFNEVEPALNDPDDALVELPSGLGMFIKEMLALFVCEVSSVSGEDFEAQRAHAEQRLAEQRATMERQAEEERQKARQEEEEYQQKFAGVAGDEHRSGNPSTTN